MALLVLVIAVLSGPYRWAAAIRSSVQQALRSIAGTRDGDRRGTLAWTGSPAAGFQLAGAVVAGILLLIVSVSWFSFLIIGVLLAAYEICLQRIKPPPPDEAPPTSGPGGQAPFPPRVGETKAGVTEIPRRAGNPAQLLKSSIMMPSPRNTHL